MSESLSKNTGFTLIELMFVLVVMAGLIALSAPLFSRSLLGVRQNTSAQDFLSLCDYARTQAMADHKRYALRMVPESQTYQLSQIDERTQDIVSVASRWGVKHTFAPGTVLQPDTRLLVFYPDGTATEFSMVLDHPGEPRLEIRVNGTTGQGSLHETMPSKL